MDSPFLKNSVRRSVPDGMNVVTSEDSGLAFSEYVTIVKGTPHLMATNEVGDKFLKPVDEWDIPKEIEGAKFVVITGDEKPLTLEDICLAVAVVLRQKKSSRLN